MCGKISIIIPCYKSGNAIESVVQSIHSEMVDVLHSDYEIILVNDSSPDNLGEVLSRLAQNNLNIKIINLARNFGQHSAIMAGMHFVSGDVVVFMDDDGQTPGNQIHVLIDKLKDGSDIVYAEYLSKKHNLYRNFFSRLNNLMSNYLLNKPKDLYIVSFFAAKRFVVDEVKKYSGPYPYLGGLFLRVTNRISTVPVTHMARENSQSSYTLSKLLKLWLNGFTSFSIKPLHISIFFGLALAGFGFIYGFYIIINRLLDPNVPMGYSSILASILFVGGMILIMLGLIGEYVGRIFLSINNAPQFIIHDTVNTHDE